MKNEDGINRSQEKWISNRLAQTQSVCTKVSGQLAFKKVAKEFRFWFPPLHPTQSFVGDH